MTWQRLGTCLVLEQSSWSDWFSGECLEWSEEFVTVDFALKETEFFGVDYLLFISCIVKAAVDFLASTVLLLVVARVGSYEGKLTICRPCLRPYQWHLQLEDQAVSSLALC